MGVGRAVACSVFYRGLSVVFVSGAVFICGGEMCACSLDLYGLCAGLFKSVGCSAQHPLIMHK